MELQDILCMEMWTLECATLILHTVDIKSQIILHSSGFRSNRKTLKYQIFSSPNEGRIFSRKPRPVSRWFQALKPFNPVVWYYLLATSFVLLLVFYFGSKIIHHDSRVARKGFIWLIVKVSFIDLSRNQKLSFFQFYETVLGHGTLKFQSKSLSYYYTFISIFFLFMMGFFYNVRQFFNKIQNSHLKQNFRAHFFHF